MFYFSLFSPALAWSITILIAWFVGEYGHEKTKLPRISIYGLVGFVLAPSQIGFLPKLQDPIILLLVNIAFGLILFECGYRINLRWLRANPWIVVTSFVEATLTFGSVYFLLKWFDISSFIALPLAVLSMATSPAVVLRVINEQRSSGQITERLLHLSSLNSVLSVFFFKVVIGLMIFQTSGNFLEAAYSSLAILLFSFILGASFGVAIPALLRFAKSTDNSTLAFTASIVCVVSLAYTLKLSPLISTLVFGVIARHRYIILSSSQRGFGALGDVLSLLLFVFISATLEWGQVLAGISLALPIIFVRQAAKITGITFFAHVSGISLRKGLLIGMAMSPLSVFVILMLEHARNFGIDLMDTLIPLAAMSLILEILGPIFMRYALIWGHEVVRAKEIQHAN